MNQFRTWMFIPGADEKKLKKVENLECDVIIYDLEDSVSNFEKEIARNLVTETVKSHPEKMNYIRINSYDSSFFYDDLNVCIVPGLRGIVLPKAETKEQIMMVDRIITEKEKKHNLPIGGIKIVPLIESALGLYHSFEIATASPRVQCLAFGAIDFVLNIQADLTKSGHEILYARSQLVVVSKAAGIEAPIDTVYADFKDHEGFSTETQLIKQLGFQGKLVIHPNQIKLVNQVFAPDLKEIEEAKKILKEYELSLAKGKGVLQVDGKMVDLPVVERARKILDTAGVYS